MVITPLVMYIKIHVKGCSKKVLIHLKILDSTKIIRKKNLIYELTPKSITMPKCDNEQNNFIFIRTFLQPHQLFFNALLLVGLKSSPAASGSDVVVEV